MVLTILIYEGLNNHEAHPEYFKISSQYITNIKKSGMEFDQNVPTSMVFAPITAPIKKTKRGRMVTINLSKFSFKIFSCFSISLSNCSDLLVGSESILTTAISHSFVLTGNISLGDTDFIEIKIMYCDKAFDAVHAVCMKIVGISVNKLSYQAIIKIKLH